MIEGLKLIKFLFYLGLCSENTSKVIFKTEYFLEECYGRIGVVGRGPGLGEWSRPVPAHEWMIRGCGTRQTAPVHIPPGQGCIEFKLVLVDDENRIIHWETEGAERNRKIPIDGLNNSIIHCYWGFQDKYDVENWNTPGKCQNVCFCLSGIKCPIGMYG